MNLRTPQEIFNNLTEKRQSAINKVIAHISSALEQSFSGQPIDVWIYDSDYQLKSIESVLRVKLKKSGWSMTVHPPVSDQRNGNSTKITIAAIDPIDPLASDDEIFEQQWER